MNQPYKGLQGTGMTPNPIQAILGPQPGAVPNQATQPQANEQTPNLGNNLMAPLPNPIQASMTRQTRGFNNTPTSGVAGTPGRSGRPPNGMNKSSSKCDSDEILLVLMKLVQDMR